MFPAASGVPVPLVTPRRSGRRRPGLGRKGGRCASKQAGHGGLKGGAIRQPILQGEHHDAELRHRTALGLEIDRLGVEQRAADGNHNEAAAAHARSLLVPQCQLSRELRVLIDACFDLQRSVNKPRFRKVEHDRRAVVRLVASPRDPADEVVPVGRREWQDLDELDLLLARQRHQHEVGLHDLRGLLTLGVHPDLGGDAPEILAVVEHPRIGHMVQTVDCRLDLQHQLRVSDVLPERWRHLGGVLEEAREQVSVRRDDRIRTVEHVERRRAVVRVDDRSSRCCGCN